MMPWKFFRNDFLQRIPEKILMQYSFVPKLLICCHENLTELHLWVNHKKSCTRDSTIELPHPCLFVTLHLYLADHSDFSQCQGSLQIPLITLFHYELYDSHFVWGNNGSRSLQFQKRKVTSTAWICSKSGSLAASCCRL